MYTYYTWPLTIDHWTLTNMAKPKPQSLFLDRVSHYRSLTIFSSLLSQPNCFNINSFGDLFHEKFTMDFSSSVFEQNLKLVNCQARAIFVNEQRRKNLIIPLQWACETEEEQLDFKSHNKNKIWASVKLRDIIQILFLDHVLCGPNK